MRFFLPAFNARGYQCFISRRQDDSRGTTDRDLYVGVFVRASMATVIDRPVIIRFHEVSLTVLFGTKSIVVHFVSLTTILLLLCQGRCSIVGH